jgi:hypothetical protein
MLLHGVAVSDRTLHGRHASLRGNHHAAQKRRKIIRLKNNTAR